MPKPLPQGFTFHVDNLSSPDSLEISLQKNKYTPAEKLGLVFISRGQLHGYSLINVIHNETIRFKVDKTNFPAGVAQAILFNSDGEILCDRLLFNNKDNQFSQKPRKRHTSLTKQSIWNLP